MRDLCAIIEADEKNHSNGGTDGEGDGTGAGVE